MSGSQFARRRSSWSLRPLACSLTPRGGRPDEASEEPSSKNYDEIYARYLVGAPDAGRTDAALDGRSHHAIRGRAGVNDLVTVRVIESLSATGAADSNVDKKSDANVTMPGKAGEALGKFLPASSDTKFNGSGGTSRTTELSAMLTARIVEVLPNGDLVVEGVREVDINGDRTPRRAHRRHPRDRHPARQRRFRRRGSASCGSGRSARG